MIVGYVRASTANQALDIGVPAQQLHDVSTEPVQQVADLFGAWQSTVHGHFGRVPARASA